MIIHHSKCIQTKKIGIVGELQSITFPYNVEQDGFLYVLIDPETSTDVSALQLKGFFDSNCNACLITSAGARASGFYLCKKGDVLEIQAQVNIKSCKIKFIPLAKES